MAALHNRRKRLAELATREAAGESFWVDSFDEGVRNKIVLAMESAVRSFNLPFYAAAARRLILEDEGLQFLVSGELNAANDFISYARHCTDEMVPTVIEAFLIACQSRRIAQYDLPNAPAEVYFSARVNEALREHRISFEIVGDEVVPFSSKELHTEVVIPALNLVSQPGWEKVEVAYQAALGELSRGDAADAITDAGTALQEALVKIGAEGNALGPLITSARKKGIILGHDVPLLEVVERASTWISADRSQVGDAHGVTAATLDDAWLTVHVVGAVILRLSKNHNRPN